MSATNERDRLLDWAVSTSRIDQGARAAWSALYDRDPVAATRDLGRMAPPRAAAAAAGARPSSPGATARASSSVAGNDEVLPRIPPGQSQITLSAGDYRVIRSLANRGLNAATSAVREKHLAAAASSGRIAHGSVGEWRAKYNADPRATVVALEALPTGAHTARPAAAAAPTAPPASSAVERWAAGEISLVKPGPGSLLGGAS